MGSAYLVARHCVEIFDTVLCCLLLWLINSLSPTQQQERSQDFYSGGKGAKATDVLIPGVAKGAELRCRRCRGVESGEWVYLSPVGMGLSLIHI